MLLKTKKEMQGLIESSRKALKAAEEKAEELSKQNKELSDERNYMMATIILHRENDNKILEVIESNSYGRTDKQKLNKIKELIGYNQLTQA